MTCTRARLKHYHVLTSSGLRVCITVELSLHSKLGSVTVPKVGQGQQSVAIQKYVRGQRITYTTKFSLTTPCLEQDIYGMETCYQLSLRSMVELVTYLLIRRLIVGEPFFENSYGGRSHRYCASVKTLPLIGADSHYCRRTTTNVYPRFPFFHLTNSLPTFFSLSTPLCRTHGLGI